MIAAQATLWTALLSVAWCWLYWGWMRRRHIRRALAEQRDAAFEAAFRARDHRSESPYSREARERAEARDAVAAWIKPNEDFILETDRILNDIEWARLTDAEQRVRKARERAEHEQMHRDNPGAIYGCCIRVGVARHDQGEAVFS